MDALYIPSNQTKAYLNCYFQNCVSSKLISKNATLKNNSTLKYFGKYYILNSPLDIGKKVLMLTKCNFSLCIFKSHWNMSPVMTDKM